MKLKWNALTDLDKWEAVAVRAVTPAGLMARTDSRVLTGRPARLVSIVHIEDGPIESPMRVAARKALWNLTKAQLMLLATVS